MSEPNSAKLCYHAICVDDDQEFLRSLQMTLSGKGLGDEPFELEPHFMNSPQDCFNLIRELVEEKETIALIISDQLMPGMTGVEFLEQANKLVPHTIKILLTGYASLDAAKYAINNHLLDHYISKPIEDYDNFHNIIVNALRTFYFKLEKEKADHRVREQMKSLQRANISLRKANEKIKNMQQAAEKIAYLAQGFKRLDLDEVLDLIITRIPPIFAAQRASLFLFDQKNNILKLMRTNFLQGGFEQPFSNTKMNPMSVALRANRILVVHNVKKAPYEFLNQDDRGTSCVIVPFVVTNQYAELQTEGGEGVFSHLEDIKGVLNLSDISHMEGRDIIQYKASLIKDILGINIWNAQLYQQTQKLAITDSLTGMYNKHIFMEFLKKECERSQRTGNGFFVAMGDIDNFKAINDTCGHLTGDEILKELGTIFHENVRKSDVIARFGGEEFAIILREHSEKDALDTLERLRRIVGEREFTKSVRTTISFGFSAYRPGNGDSHMALIERADTALYRAKSQGKNRVESDSQSAE